jgi:hypothetical protein
MARHDVRCVIYVPYGSLHVLILVRWHTLSASCHTARPLVAPDSWLQMADTSLGDRGFAACVAVDVDVDEQPGWAIVPVPDDLEEAAVLPKRRRGPPAWSFLGSVWCGQIIRAVGHIS